MKETFFFPSPNLSKARLCTTTKQTAPSTVDGMPTTDMTTNICTTDAHYQSLTRIPCERTVCALKKSYHCLNASSFSPAPHFVTPTEKKQVRIKCKMFQWNCCQSYYRNIFRKEYKFPCNTRHVVWSLNENMLFWAECAGVLHHRRQNQPECQQEGERESAQRKKCMHQNRWNRVRFTEFKKQNVRARFSIVLCSWLTLGATMLAKFHSHIPGTSFPVNVFGMIKAMLEREKGYYTVWCF